MMDEEYVVDSRNPFDEPPPQMVGYSSMSVAPSHYYSESLVDLPPPVPPKPSQISSSMRDMSLGPSGVTLLPGPPFMVTLSNAQVMGEGLKAFLTFEIEAKALVAEFRPIFRDAPHVRRSYKDFLALREQLMTAHPAVILPFPFKGAQDVVVDKKHGYTKELIDRRKKKFERFLFRVASHPILCRSPELHRFLTDPSAEMPPPKSLATGALQLVKKAVASATGSSAAPNDPAAQLIEYFKGYEWTCGKAQDVTKNLVKEKQEMASHMSNLGLIFDDLSRREVGAINKPILEVFTEMFRCAVSAATLLNVQAEAEKSSLEDLFKEQSYFCQGYKEVEDKRAELYDKVEKLESALTSNRAKLDSLQKTGHTGMLDKYGKQAKGLLGQKGPDQTVTAEKLQLTISQIESELKIAREIYKEFCSKVREEADRYQATKSRDYRSMLLAFTRAQLEFHSQAAQTWESALQKIESIPES